MTRAQIDESSVTAVSALLPLDDRPGPAQPLAEERVDAMINSALDVWVAEREQEPPTPASLGIAPRPSVPAEVGAPTTSAPKGSFPQPPSSSWWPKMAAAAMLAVAIGATAAAARQFIWPYESAPTTNPVATPQAAEIPPDRASNEPAASPAEEVEPTEADTHPAASEVTEAPRRKPPEQAPRRPSKAKAEDLLARGNALRGQGEWRAAERTYLELAQRYPNTASAYVAQVAAASLRLEQLNDPQGARRLYAEADRKRPGGNLDLEIRQGMARAARRLGNAEAEGEALRGVMTQHPGTPAAHQAARRMTELVH